jgi:simple sugar transport system permease protein
MRLRLNENNIPLLATAVVCVSLFAAGAVRYHDVGFFTARNVIDMLAGNAFLGVVAVGMTFVILSGGIDLSVGSVVALAGVLIGWAVKGRGIHPAVAIPAVLVGGTLFGAAMGCLIHFFRLPAFLVTLAGMFLARGLGFLVSLESIPLGHPWYLRASEWAIPLGRLGGKRPVGLPLPAVVFLVTLAAAAYVAKMTPFGRNVYAIGGNEHSSLLMGLPVGRTKIGVYALSGFCAALGGVVYTIYTLSGDPRSAFALERRRLHDLHPQRRPALRLRAGARRHRRRGDRRHAAHGRRGLRDRHAAGRADPRDHPGRHHIRGHAQRRLDAHRHRAAAVRVHRAPAAGGEGVVGRLELVDNPPARP